MILWTPGRGESPETDTGNLAVFRQGCWTTPPVTDGLLGALAPECGTGIIREGHVCVWELRSDVRIAVFNSVRGWQNALFVCRDCPALCGRFMLVPRSPLLAWLMSVSRSSAPGAPRYADSPSCIAGRAVNALTLAQLGVKRLDAGKYPRQPPGFKPKRADTGRRGDPKSRPFGLFWRGLGSVGSRVRFEFDRVRGNMPDPDFIAPPRNTTRRARERVEILDAAARVFRRRGYGAATKSRM